MSWIVRLEHQRVLRDGDTSAVAGPTPAAANVPDLVVLVRDPDPSLRHRAALAIGRVGMADGLAPLTIALSDPEPDVRAIAAFAMGLIGDKLALPALQAALADPSPVVRGRAIEALGLIADPSAAPWVAQAAVGCGPLIAPLSPDDEAWPKSPEIEMCRLALFSLARLRQLDALAQVAIDATGQPVSRWWPVAFALSRVGDPRGAVYLPSLATGTGVYTASFALRGLALAKHPALLSIAVPLLGQPDVDIKLRVAAVRALATAADQAALTPLVSLLGQPGLPVNLLIETIVAIGAFQAPTAFEPLLDLLTHPAPAVRSAALSAASRSNAEAFLLVLSGLGRDEDWSVRAALAGVLATLPADRVSALVEDLASDEDVRVHGAALTALVALKAPSASSRLITALEAADFVVRGTAADLLGDLKPAGAAEALVAAYTRGASDSAYGARASAIGALAKIGGDPALATLRRALADPDWPVRTRAAELLRGLGQTDAAPERPAPLRQPLDVFASPAVLRPDYSPHAFIETRHGTVEIQLDVVDAPVTAQMFIEQARSGWFNGMKAHRIVPGFVVQAGDPRGDGEGGPGYTVRDELSPTPYLRGTLGMALAWKDTGGSQWFITLGPQPHLDAKYSVFGRVVNGWDVLDRIAPWDVIDRVRIWDGVEFR